MSGPRDPSLLGCWPWALSGLQPGSAHVQEIMAISGRSSIEAEAAALDPDMAYAE